jgi:hypothetical protein
MLGCMGRKVSRKTLRSLFLSTAFPVLREMQIAYRNVSSGARVSNKESAEPFTLRPEENRNSNLCFPFKTKSSLSIGPYFLCFVSETVSTRRPFLRLRESTLRPFFVAIRARNPCTRARRTLWGWNVLFIGHLPVCKNARTLVRNLP